MQGLWSTLGFRWKAAQQRCVGLPVKLRAQRRLQCGGGVGGYLNIVARAVGESQQRKIEDALPARPYFRSLLAGCFVHQTVAAESLDQPLRFQSCNTRYVWATNKQLDGGSTLQVAEFCATTESWLQTTVVKV